MNKKIRMKRIRGRLTEDKIKIKSEELTNSKLWTCKGNNDAKNHEKKKQKLDCKTTGETKS